MIECTVPDEETIAKGDAVCVIDFDTDKNRPTVKRATRDNLADSKTIFGVAKDDADGGSVIVLVAGDVAENDVTGLGAGNSRIIATDIDNATAEAQCRLIRTDRSGFIVGTCDEEGNLVVQSRSSRDTSNLHVFNVTSYGARGDGATDDSNAIRNAISAIATSGGRLLFPPGKYSVASKLTIPSYVHITFQGGAMLVPSGAAVTIQGPVTCHPTQHVFSGTGFNDESRRRSRSSDHHGKRQRARKLFGCGGDGAEDNRPDLPATHFRYIINGVLPSPPPLLIAPSVALPFTGLTVGFEPGPYEQGSSYSWTSLAPITLGPAAFDRFNVRNFGAVPNWDGKKALDDGTANLAAFEAALAAMAGDDNKSAILVADGHFFLSGTLHIRQTVVSRARVAVNRGR